MASSTTTTALAVASVTASGNDGNVPNNTIDNNFSTRWSCFGKGSWIRYDLGSIQNIAEIDIAWYNGDKRQSNYVIAFSNDASTWLQASRGTSSGKTTSFEKYPVTGDARYVRITVNGNTVNDWASMTEVRIIGSSSPPTTTEAPPTTTTTPTSNLTKSGIKLMYAPKTGGFYWELDLTKDPNMDAHFSTQGDKCTAKSDANVKYYNMPGHTVTYASGAPSGVTCRLCMYFDGGKGSTQTHTWKDQTGFLWKDGDPKNFIVISTVRPHNSLSSSIHHEASIKCRGGTHTGSGDPRASTVEMTHESGTASPRWAREYNHPRYDYRAVDAVGTNARACNMVADKWFMRQLISKELADGTGVLYEYYINVNPFNADGTVNNNTWELYSRTIDRDGVNTGQYTKAAKWSGFVTTARTDGYKDIDIGPHALIEIPAT